MSQFLKNVHALMLRRRRVNYFFPNVNFSIDRVFRNETLDNTHLAEFHQVEGLVADYNVSLADLIGVLHEFFRKLGIEKLKFKVNLDIFSQKVEIFLSQI